MSGRAHVRLLVVGMAAGLIVSVAAVLGIVHLQRTRIQCQETARLIMYVQDEVDALYGSVGPVLEVARASPDPVSTTLLAQARERSVALDTALDRLTVDSPDVGTATVVERARAFSTAVLTTLTEVAAPGAHGSRDQVVTSAHTILDPLYHRLRGDLARMVATGARETASADREAVWGSGGLVGLLMALLAALAWWSARTRAQVVHRTTVRNARRFESLISNLSDVITVLDTEGRVTYQSPSLAVCLGVAADRVLTDVLHPDDTAMLSALVADPAQDQQPELRLQHGDGTYHWWETRVTDLLDDATVGGLVLTSRDVTERRALEGRLADLAYRDPLTGLGNRAALHRRLNGLHEDVPRPAQVVLFLVDLDDFKAVNDTLGHDVGDRVLQVVGERLRDAVRAGELVVRLGGDEFALVVDGGRGEVTEPLARRLTTALERSITVSGRDILLSACTGIASITLPGAEAADGGPDRRRPRARTLPGRYHEADGAEPQPWVVDLLRRADIALYAAKAQGKGRWECFDPEMEQRTRDRVEVHAALREAQARDELVVHYQPVLDLGTGTVRSLEALLRWRRASGIVGPERFIDVAEDSGLIVGLGAWVLRQACADLARLQAMVPAAATVSVAVNVSGRQLVEPGLRTEVCDALHSAGVPAERLVIEVTETLLSRHPQQATVLLEDLRRTGVRVAVDDFGIGYSSLGRLTDLPVDVIKIDRSFVRPLNRPGSTAHAVVTAILALAGALGLESIAEGVETPRQREVLHGKGCDLAQGYLFARPLPFTDLVKLLRRTPALLEQPLPAPAGAEPSAADRITQPPVKPRSRQ